MTALATKVQVHCLFQYYCLLTVTCNALYISTGCVYRSYSSMKEAIVTFRVLRWPSSSVVPGKANGRP